MEFIKQSSQFLLHPLLLLNSLNSLLRLPVFVCQVNILDCPQVLILLQKRMHSTTMGVMPLRRLFERRLSCLLQRDSTTAAAPRISISYDYKAETTRDDRVHTIAKGINCVLFKSTQYQPRLTRDKY